nr:ABC transporter ATP-binding protein [Mesorhizobium japonicum]
MIDIEALLFRIFLYIERTDLGSSLLEPDTTGPCRVLRGLDLEAHLGCTVRPGNSAPQRLQDARRTVVSRLPVVVGISRLLASATFNFGSALTFEPYNAIVATPLRYSQRCFSETGMIKGESLQLRRVCKQYGDYHAIKDVSVQIEAGEFVSFLGPSGSGKTTTLMMIAGFETPTSGEIIVGDRAITSLPVHRRNIGVVFQNYALFPHLSVFENVAFALKMRAVARDEISRGVAEALNLVQLSGYETRMPHELSGGQQQRVALARSLVFRPGVILMDEPLGALDKQLREHMQVELKRLQRSLGTTVIFVTHDQSEALTMSDRIVVMNEGRIAQVGTPEEIYEAPSSRFVASFIGESNFLQATIIEASKNGPLLDVHGLRVRATWAQGKRPKGSAGTLMVRPEKIIPLGSSGKADNEFEGVVQEAIYWGNIIKYRVHLREAKSVSLTVALPYHSSSPKFQLNETIRVGWDARDSRLLVDESERQAGNAPEPELLIGQGIERVVS